MYRRYYRYNDPAPAVPTRKQATPTTAANTSSKLPTPELNLNRLLSGAAKDDLVLIGILLLVLLSEDKSEIDYPLVFALIYLLLQK